MPREQISIEIPDEWNENMKHGRCWCGKDHSEFAKGQKFYCSTKHAKEYAKRIKYWSVFKEEVLDEMGSKCTQCGYDKDSFDKQQEKLRKKTFQNKAKEYPEAIKQARAVMITELQEKFEQIKDDGYVLEHMSWEIAEEHFISRSNDMFERKWFSIEVDHIVAVSLGGAMWDKKNLRPLCSECHKIKTKEDMKKLKIQRTQEKNQTLEMKTVDCK